MNEEKLYEAMGSIDEKYLEESEKLASHKSYCEKTSSLHKKTAPRHIAAAACLALLIGGVFIWKNAGNNTQDELSEITDTTEEKPEAEVDSDSLGTAKMLMQAILPDTVQAADTASEKEEAAEAGIENTAALAMDLTETFTSPLISNELAPDDGKNHIWSPVNLTMALAMLSETTAGDTRSQILKAMNVASIEDLRKSVDGLLQNTYYDNENGTSIPANSIWLRDRGSNYNNDTLKILSRQYSASSFAGDMGSGAYNAMLHDWLNEQTHNLLKDKSADLSLTSDTMLALASTIYYHADWMSPFEDYQINDRTFHAPSGDRKVSMLHTVFYGTYYRGNNFGAVNLTLKDGNIFWFFLPDEGYTVQDILKSEDVQRILRMDPELVDGAQTAEIYLEFPKFDISSESDIVNTLSTMKITDVLDPAKADFSPLFSGYSNVALSRIDHATRISVDEWGVTAAAYTVESLDGGAFYDGEHIDYICDRPFTFAITDSNRITFFEGVVNEP